MQGAGQTWDRPSNLQLLTTAKRLQGFDEEPHLQLLREMLRHLFATPVKHHKSKPFADHVLSFHVADGRIWLRNYQVRRCRLGIGLHWVPPTTRTALSLPATCGTRFHGL